MKLAEQQRDLLVTLSIWSVVLAVAGFVSAAVGKLAEHRAARVRHDAQWRAMVRQQLQESSGGALPRLAELSDAVLGATPTRYTAINMAPYVPRPVIDGRLDGLLTQAGPPFPFVLVVGASKAGKSRTTAQAARRNWGKTNPRMLLPLDGEALAKLMRLDPPLPLTAPTPVWLDDLTAADLSHLSSDVLDAVAQRGCLVATMTEERWNQIRNSGGEVASTARAALHRATKVTLEFELTDSEAVAARRLYPQEQITASIGETLVGAHALLDKYRVGRSEQPAGCAVVQAAVDARRAGLSRPITSEELLRLFPLYLRRIRIDLDPTAALFDEGLAWAKQPVASQVALITTVPAGHQILDYIVAVDDGQEEQPQRQILDQLWAELIAIIQPSDAFNVGIGATLRRNREAAITAMRKAWDSDDPDTSPTSAFNLGALLKEAGDLQGARDAYQRAIDSGHFDAAPLAAASLGQLLDEQGDLRGARIAYQRAIDSGHAFTAPLAALNLGVLLDEQDDLHGARIAYQRAIDSGHFDAAPMAAGHLGSLLKVKGDLHGARIAYQRAIDSGHFDAAPMAAACLGKLLEEQGDLQGARIAYQRAIDSGHFDVAPMAAGNLGLLLTLAGDLPGARDAYQRAIDSGHAFAAPMAAASMGQILEEEGDLQGACDAYLRFIDTGHHDSAPTAAVKLGVLLERQGDLQGASDAFQRAVESDHSDAAPLAAVCLGKLLEGQGDLHGARNAYQRAIDSGHIIAAPTAAVSLAVLLEGQGDLQSARDAYQRAIDSGHPELALIAADFLDRHGDLQGPREPTNRS